MARPSSGILLYRNIKYDRAARLAQLHVSSNFRVANNAGAVPLKVQFTITLLNAECAYSTQHSIPVLANSPEVFAPAFLGKDGPQKHIQDFSIHYRKRCIFCVQAACPNIGSGSQTLNCASVS